MKKRFIWALIIIMVITITWFFFIQIKWIRGAMLIREKQFVNLVENSLSEIVTKLEQREIVMQISNEAVSFTYDSLNVGNNFSNFNKNIINNFINFHSPSSDLLISSIDTNFHKISNDYNDTTDFSVNENIYKKISNKTIFVQNIVNELISKKININERLSPKIINSSIKTAFNKRGIDFKYEFAIKVSHKGYHYKTKKFNKDQTDEIFEVQLFPNDILNYQKIYLQVYFPHEKESVFFTLPKIAFTTAFITLLIISVFIITISIIFKQKKLSEMKNDFINNMTHELKTPISTISLASQMLKDKSIPTEEKDFSIISNIIDDETKRLGFQVEKILQMAIIERGFVKFKNQNINIHDLLEKIITNFALKIKNKNAKIIKNFNAINQNIIGDEIHIANIFYNLIDNALKYTNEDPIIEIKTLNNNSKILIVLKDNGIGITKEDQKRVFKKFFRVSTGNLHDVKGFGLGLSYVKRIVIEHKGKISIKSKINKGTSFIISLPILK